MKLQVALDYFSINEALKLMEKIHPYVDIVEIGSPLMYADGFHAIAEIKNSYPEKLVLADAKIVDGGYDIASRLFEKGADIVTSIGMTNNETLSGLVRAARERGRWAMVDTIGVPNLAERARELEDMGFDYILVHTAHDMLNCISAPIEALRIIKKSVGRAKVGISGGITPSQMPEIVAEQPDWVVVGSSLTLARDPELIAREFHQYM